MNSLIVVSVLRYVIIAITLPGYGFVLWNYQVIKGIWNSYLRGLFDKSFVTERRDLFWAKTAFILLAFYAGHYLKPLQYVLKVPIIHKFVSELISYNYLTYKDLYLCYYYLLFWFKKVQLIALIYVPLEQLVLKPLLVSAKSSLEVQSSIRMKYREKAISRKCIFAGVDTDTQKPLYLTNAQRQLHVEITGTTGAGKTESAILPWSYQDIRAGKGAIIIEAKGSIDFYKKLYTLCKMADCQQHFYICNLSDPVRSNTYNPLFRGSAVELKDRIMGAFDWSEQFYKDRAESILLTILQAVESTGKKITFMDLYLLFTEIHALEALYRQVPDEFRKWNLGSKVLGDFKQVQKDCAGIIAKLNLMSLGGVSEIINTYTPDIDLLEIYRNNEVVYFCLPTNLIGETAKAFGRMLLMDLRSTSGYIEQGKAQRRFFPAFIDEFAEFASVGFVTWLNKSRSTGIAIHIAHQSYGDLKQVNPSFVDQVTDNTNIKMVFRVNSPDTAEAFSTQLGTETTWKETEMIDKSLLLQRQGPKGSLREVEEFVVHPNVIKRLPMGRAIIFGKHPKEFNHLIQTDYIPDPKEFIPIPFSRGQGAGDGCRGFNFRELVLKRTAKNSPQPAGANSEEKVFSEDESYENKSQSEKQKNHSEVPLQSEYPDQEIEMHLDLTTPELQQGNFDMDDLTNNHYDDGDEQSKFG
ncbi:MAG: type IV secretory system conjugative DNA transfer family protein [Bacteroidota bacterium]